MVLNLGFVIFVRVTKLYKRVTQIVLGCSKDEIVSVLKQIVQDSSKKNSPIFMNMIICLEQLRNYPY